MPQRPGAIRKRNRTMLDLAAILFTTALCVFATFRAVEMDRRLPWFGRGPAADREAAPQPEDKAARRRRG